ncbi:MAG: hypothetical protein KOO62_05750 [candidate division Zixibacteria bacterium]|nr:hypothetical protein [candidate division Zixibacteria bacterium]
MVDDLAKRLESEGWTQLFTASGTRLDEAIETYRELGFEIKTVPIKELGGNDCSVCFDDASDKTVMIFTRPGQTIDE